MGGFFCGLSKNRSYIDASVDWFDQCECDTWSLLWIEDFIAQLGYVKSSLLRIYWCLPDKNLCDGLRPLKCDADTINMVNEIVNYKNLVLYLDHVNLLENQKWDDVLVDGTPELPAVISPRKVVYIEKKTTHKLPAFYDRISSPANEATDGAGGSQFSDEEEEKIDEEDSNGEETDTEFVDSDYEMDIHDDDLFEDNIDEGVQEDELFPDKGKRLVEYESNGDDDHGEGKKVAEDECLQLPIQSDDECKIRFNFKPFKSEVDMANPQFKLGMVFSSVEHLREAIAEYSIKNRVEIKKSRNERKRLEAHCAEGCPWFLYATEDSRAKCFLIKRYVGTHTCQREWEIKTLTAKYLAKKYIENFRDDDKMSLKAFAKLVQRQFNMTPNRYKLGRARKFALDEIYGDEINQYNCLWDYAKELRRTNPGSTCYLGLNVRCFSTLYYSLDACKRGFLKGCRPIICLDGCHIKTKFGGQLLTAVGIDPNDCIFPIAVGVVEVECTSSWTWFLTTLKSDLHIINTAPFTIMSDKQKGLINAVKKVFSDSEHRFCVRHLYQNLNMSHKGETVKNHLWACARSTSIPEWEINMQKMKKDCPGAHAWLEEVSPITWVRAFFSDFPKCDILLNNNCEVFNSYILDAREMPILTMLEKIRCQLMNRFYTKQKEAIEKWTGRICPKIKKKVQKNADLASTCFVLPAGMGVFEVTDKEYKYVVEVTLRTCTCRRWQLTGIPCSHAISCFRHERIKIEDMVSSCYSLKTYMQAYGSYIWPVRDKAEWEKMHGANVLPPVYDKKIGRPKKSRRKQPIEQEGGTKLSKHGVVIHCSYCHGTGHNKKGCPHLKEGAKQMPIKRRRRNTVVAEDGEFDDPTILEQIILEEPIPDLDPSQMIGTVISNLMHETPSGQGCMQQPGPLPEENAFVAENRDSIPPPRVTTATTEGRAITRRGKGGSRRGRGNGIASGGATGRGGVRRGRGYGRVYNLIFGADGTNNNTQESSVENMNSQQSGVENILTQESGVQN